jgi:putative hydrolase of the HAD superfamily
MPRKPRALLLDLDDTLYPIARFRASGFMAVARHVARLRLLDECTARRALVSASRGSSRGRELDLLIARYRLPLTVVELRSVMRAHRPTLRLPAATVTTLRRLRRTWRLAVVTNGMPAIQARKVAALGLERFVHTVVYAAEHGLGEGKPDGAAFVEALRRVDVSADRAVAVGDDEFADVFGATRCGVRAVHTRQWKRGPMGPMAICADAVVRAFSEVPDVAERLLPGRIGRHAA